VRVVLQFGRYTFAEKKPGNHNNGGIYLARLCPSTQIFAAIGQGEHAERREFRKQTACDIRHSIARSGVKQAGESGKWSQQSDIE
jgi:hypothetical protein